MTERERLAELLAECITIRECSFAEDKRPTCEELADYLLNKGVICPPCKVGDAVWVVNQTKGTIFQNVVDAIHIIGMSDLKNSVRLKYTNALKEISFRKFTFRQFGRNVFLTREAAETALAERRKA